ncbi:hypothetical protein B0H10DRAFT_1962076 [Mycena sp. CBHHK59/15]|nr:hypothetical protein B0H10DRAFT_1962076 [Mycena sp. CBHHK59/15]
MCTIPARPPQVRKPNFSEFEVEVDQRLWAKHTECSNKPTNPVTGPDTSITTGPSASKDAWSARFSPSVSAPVRGHGMAPGLSSADGGARIAAASVGCSGVTVAKVSGPVTGLVGLLEHSVCCEICIWAGWWMRICFPIR